MTIRRKVQLGLAVILVMFAALSAFAINQVTVMSRHFNGLTEKVIPTLGLSAQMSLVLDKLRVTQAYQVLDQSVDDNVLRMDILKLQAQMNKLQEQYRVLVTDPAQTDALNALAIEFDAYIESSDSLRIGAAGDRGQGALQVLRDSEPAHARLMARLADLDDLTRDLADKAVASSQEAADRANTGALIGVVGMAIALLGLIVLTSRDILRPMRRLIGAINRLADNDLETEIPLTTRRDELGDVARALQHFRANAIEKERLQKQEQDDLAFARRIQLASVPRRFPAFPERRELDVAGRLAPMRAVGGDFFDFYLIDPDRLVIAIGDASGKGVASAMFVGIARSALKAEATRTAEPALCLTEANRALAADNESMMFMTAFYAVLDLRTGELTYANAGHTPAYIIGPERRAEALAADPGLPLGIEEQFTFTAHQRRLEPGEAIVLYTDGVTEAVAVDGTLFGERRLEELLAEPRTAGCDVIVAEIFDAVTAFSKGTPQADDIALLVVRYNGLPGATSPEPARTAAAYSAEAD
jgi:sigma-B regulation protein RsbU (phosphoserine phosphatase)